MFKHLTRIATAKRAGAQGIQQFSKQALVVRNTPMISQMMTYQRALFSVATQRDLSSVISDYTVNQTADIKRLVLTEEEMRAKHPSEYATAHRAKVEYSMIKKNQFLLFNLPKSLTQIKLDELLQAKGVQVLKARLNQSLDNENFAYAFIEVGSPTQVKTLKDKFRNLWIEDKKLKLKTSEDLKTETYNNRTLVVRNIPHHYHNKQLVEIFSNFGALVSVELPTKNMAIEQELQNRVDSYVADKREKQQLDVRRAQKVVQDSLKENEQHYRAILTDSLGPEESQRIMLAIGEDVSTTNSERKTKFLEVLDEQRQASIQSILAQLQSESAEVSKAKSILENLKIQASQAPSLGSTFEKESSSMLKNTLSYINQNREALDESTLASLNDSILNGQQDPIQALQALSREELATSYDLLLTCLKQRESLIESRIKKQIGYLGVEERVLFDHKDWNRETEDLKDFTDAFGAGLNVEEILSVSEQVQNIRNFKTMTPEERLYEIVNKTYNPFLEANFNQRQLETADSEKLNAFRIPREAPNPNLAPSLNRMMFKGYNYQDNNLQKIKEQVAELRDRFDLPFDELYHKERKLVDQVINATQALQQKEAQLPNPMGANRIFNPSELKEEYLGEKYESEHQYLRDQRKRNNKLLNESIDNAGSTNFQFTMSDTKSRIQELRENGVITQKDYDQLVLMQEEAQTSNLGYAFVTYSHSDETKLAIILAQALQADGVELDLSIKHENIDHKDFDFQYQMNKKRNESKIVNELESLREKRAELRDFEKNIDKDLPSLKKIKEFRELGRDLIDNPSRPKIGSMINRSQAEEQALNDKIRELQKENPDIDYTALFDTERAEQARKTQHKKAFASYKAFQFLKHGVELQSRGASTVAAAVPQQTIPAAYKTTDPYDFLPLQQIVDSLMKTRENFPRVRDAGDQLDQKAGRKFGYTDQDFIEAYFGKDLARNDSLEFNYETNLFGFNDSYKHKYPIDKYQKMPWVEAQKKILQDRADLPGIPEEAKDASFYQYMDKLDTKDVEYNVMKDTPHPTDKSRSLIKDAQSRLEGYMKRKEKQSGIPMWNTRDVAGIKMALREEYFPKKKSAPAPPAEGGAAPTDTKAVEKFEPFFEGEKADPHVEDPIVDEPTVTIEKRPAKTTSSGQKRQHESATSGGAKKSEQSPFYAGQITSELTPGVTVSGEQKESNRTFLYDYKHRKRNNQNEGRQEGVKTQRIEKTAQANGMTGEDLLDQMKDWGNISEDPYLTTGKFQQKSKAGMLKTEADVQGRQKKTRNLEDFASTTQEGDLSEREDEDIYQHYMEQMRLAKLQGSKKDQDTLSKEESLAKEKLNDLENMYPEMPRFEGFFKSLSQGKHPFEEESSNPLESDLKAEEAFDKELLERELQGRLIGETLTPRQFATLFNAKADGSTTVKFMKTDDRAQFLDNRDMVRMLEEQREASRRRMVLSGECSEAESYGKMRDAVRESDKNAPEEYEHYKNMRDYKDLKNMFFNLQNTKQVFDKEYYFDEGLGESLKAHVDTIKERFPEVEVLVRRDRDGYPIVKTQYKPTYKYSLEDIDSFDAERENLQMKESLEDILRVINGGGNNLQSLDKTQMEQKLMMLQKGGSGGEVYDFDEKTKDQVSKLWRERVSGRFQNDREGFAKAFLSLSEKATFDESKKLSTGLLHQSEEGAPEQVFSQLAEEREMMTYELAEQLSVRIKEHLYLKERKTTDFVKGRRSETSLFASQVQNQSNALKMFEKQAAEVNPESAEFDKEAYQQIKQEIKSRREAKERLLQQGFPELKPYINI